MVKETLFCDICGEELANSNANTTKKRINALMIGEKVNAEVEIQIGVTRRQGSTLILCLSHIIPP